MSFKKNKYQIIKKAISKELAVFIANYFCLQKLINNNHKTIELLLTFIKYLLFTIILYYYLGLVNCFGYRPMRSRTSGFIMSLPHCGCMVILTLHFKFGMLSTFCWTSLGIRSAAGQNAEVRLISTWT